MVLLAYLEIPRRVPELQLLLQRCASQDSPVPTVHRQVTLPAVRRKSICHMIRIARFAELIAMATYTIRGETEAVELPYRANLVARITIRDGVRPDERKPILVLIDVVNRDLPAIWVMAQFTFRPVLSPVEIRVAVLTFFWNIAEVEIGVTVHTRYFRVPPPQRESGLRVLELHIRSQWLPSLLRVTLVARNVERFSVRTVVPRILIRLLRPRGCCGKGQRDE